MKKFSEKGQSILTTCRKLFHDYFYPIRCIRIDDPHHKMDSPESDMVLYYDNMRGLPYLFR